MRGNRRVSLGGREMKKSIGKSLSCAAQILAMASLSALAPNQAAASEPNETFATRTILPSGVTTFSDELSLIEVGPDLTLGAFDDFGFLFATDDNSSVLGNGTASELTIIDVDPDTAIHLAISGFGDFDFDGLDDTTGLAHTEAGDFFMYVDLYDAADSFVGTVLVESTLTAGGVVVVDVEADDFGVPTLAGHNYDAITDNTINDVDFVTFTGLPAGASYVAEITTGEIDTILASFDEFGDLVDLNDDNGESLLSKLEGIVPLNGELHFAVTGFADFDFFGFHDESGSYTLELSFVPEPATAGVLTIGALCLTHRRKRTTA